MNTDAAWQQAVIARFGQCERCGTTERLAGHHVVPRRYHKTRHDIKNGICLCVKCHSFVHSSIKKGQLFCDARLVIRGDFQSIGDLLGYKRVAKYPKDKINER